MALASAFVGCTRSEGTGQQPPAARPPEPARAPNDLAPLQNNGAPALPPPEIDVTTELDLVAECFFDAVTELQSEPADDEDLATYLERAGAAWRGRDAEIPAECASLDLADAGPRACRSAGQTLRFERTRGSHNRFGDGHDELHITYRFHCGDLPVSSETTITLSIGG